MHRIMKMKDHLVDFALQQMSQGLEPVNTKEMGEVIDMIKDLAQVEESCAEALYYNSVAEAMEGKDRYGYNATGYNGSPSMRRGYDGQDTSYNTNQGSMNTRRGYSEEPVENLRMSMMGMDPMKRMQVKRELEALCKEL